MQFDSPRHHEILSRMHTGKPLCPTHQRIGDLNLVSLATTISATCPHALMYATATEGVEFLQAVGEELCHASDSLADFSQRVLATACAVAHTRSPGHGALFDFDRWLATFGAPALLVGRHESVQPAIEELGERDFAVEVLSYVRFVQRFMSPGMPLELLAADAPRSRPQRLRATRTTRGIEVAEVSV